MTRLDITGELTTYGLRIAKCERKERIKEILEELRKEIPTWKKELYKED